MVPGQKFSTYSRVWMKREALFRTIGMQKTDNALEHRARHPGKSRFLKPAVWIRTERQRTDSTAMRKIGITVGKGVPGMNETI